MEQSAQGHRDQVDLLRAATGGDPRAVRSIMDEHMPVVYGFVLARVGGNRSAAEEILQETLLEAIRSADSFRGESELSTWLCAIARRRTYRHYEKERREELAASRLAVVEETDPWSESVEQRDRVLRALRDLSPLHRQVLVMKYLDELSVEELAGRIRRSRTQVQSLLQRARDAMRRSLEQPDG